MSTVNSFGARTALEVGGRTVQMLQPARSAGCRISRNRQPAVLDQNPAGEPPAAGRRPVRQEGRHRSAGAVGSQVRPAAGNFVRARARAAAGFHRRAGGRGPCGDARRHRAARRRSESRESAAAGGARHRSLGAGGLLRPAGCVSAERRARVLAQQRALRVPEVGTGRLRQLPGGAARHRHRPSGQHRVPRACGRHQRHG